jgi:hypothetical protein
MRDKNAAHMIQAERRQARSEDTQVALTRLLEGARHASALEALALGDELGLLVAGAGAAELCDELAAVAPLFGSATNRALENSLTVLGHGTEVRRLAVLGYDLFISGRGGDLGAALGLLAAGCARILVEKKPPLCH